MVNRIFGTKFSDVLYGDSNSSDRSDIIFGLPGDDSLYGFSDDPGAVLLHSNDVLHGGEGNDLLQGGSGQDVLFGGLGNDVLGQVSVNFASAIEAGDDLLYGGSGDDRISGGDGNDTLYGGDGNDTLGDYMDAAGFVGQDAGDDQLDGGSGNDRLSGGDGNDWLYGGEGEDVLGWYYRYSPYQVGFDAGNDFYFGGSGNDRLLDGEGNDELHGGTGDDWVGNLYFQRFSFEAVGNDRMYGDAGNDRIFGGLGDDWLAGGSGDDEIGVREIDPPYWNQEPGNDEIDAGSGNDIVQGGTGDDRIQGGTGNDQLYGNDGSDRLTGVNPDRPFPGLGEVDVLIGDQGPTFSPLINLGADRFILANTDRLFYDDQQAATAGIADYALIKDFSLAQNDLIQLKGNATDYRLGSAAAAPGTAIFLTAGQTPELIAIVQAESLTGFEQGFVFV